MATQSRFETLPVEILRAIVSTSPTASMLALMQTSRGVYERVEPLLYENIEWNVERTYRKPTVHQLLERLLDRPEVASWVRSFTMTGRFNQKIYTGLTRESIKALLDRATAAHPTLFDGYETEEWWHLIYSSSTVMLVSLLLLLCPNITHVTPWSGFSESPQRLRFLARAIRTIPNLKMIDYGTQNGKFPTVNWKDASLDFISDLKSVRHLRLQLTEDPIPGSCTRDETAFGICMHITTLDLHSTYLSEAHLAELLSKFPNVRCLKLGLLRETKFTASSDLGVSSFIDCDLLRDALSALKSTLQSLTITVEYYSLREWHRASGGPWSVGREGNPGISLHWGLKGALRDLRSFYRLEHLEIDRALLVGMERNADLAIWEVVPAHLKTLKLRADFISCTAYQFPVATVAKQIEETVGRYKELEGVVWQFPKEQETTSSMGTVKELRDFCTGKGVILRVELLT